MRTLDEIEENIRALQHRISTPPETSSIAMEFDDSILQSKFKPLVSRVAIADSRASVSERNIASARKTFTSSEYRKGSVAVPFVKPAPFMPERIEVELITVENPTFTYQGYRSIQEIVYSYPRAFDALVSGRYLETPLAYPKESWDLYLAKPSRLVFGSYAVVSPVQTPPQSPWKPRVYAAYYTSFALNSNMTSFKYQILAYLSPYGSYSELADVFSKEEIIAVTYQIDRSYGVKVKYKSHPLFPGSYLALSNQSYNRLINSPYVLNEAGGYYEPEMTLTKGPWVDYTLCGKINRKPTYMTSPWGLIRDGDTIAPTEILEPDFVYYPTLASNIAWYVREVLRSPTTFEKYNFRAPHPYGKEINNPTVSNMTQTDNYELYELPVYSPAGLVVGNGSILAGFGNAIHTDKTFISGSSTYRPGTGCHIAVSYPDGMRISSTVEINRARRTGADTYSEDGYSVCLLTKDHYGWDDMEMFEVARYGLE
jgi:hypothetical protein